jgi:hypothetical protein
MRARSIILSVFIAAIVAVIPRSAPGGDSTKPAGSNFGPTRQVEIFDPLLNMVAFTLNIPKDWLFEGTILHGPICGGGDFSSVVYRTSSPDTQYGVQVAPNQFWVWAENRQSVPDGALCKYLPPMSAIDYANLYAARMRPAAVVDASGPGLNAEEFYASLEKKNENGRTHTVGSIPPWYDTGDVARIRVHYDWQGHAEEEWITAAMDYSDRTRNVFVYRQPVRLAHYLATNTNLVGCRAPKGRLDQYDAALFAIAHSLTRSPQYEQAWDAHEWDVVRRNIAAGWQLTHSLINNMNQQAAISRQNTQNFMDNLTRQNQQFIANMNQQAEIRHQNAMAQINAQGAQAKGFISQMDSRTAHTRDVQDYVLDQQYYVNPSTGETQTLSGRANHAWTNGPATSNATSTVQTNGNFNPNGNLTGNWTELQPINH